MKTCKGSVAIFVAVLFSTLCLSQQALAGVCASSYTCCATDSDCTMGDTCLSFSGYCWEAGGGLCSTDGDCPSGHCNTLGVCDGGSNAGGACLTEGGYCMSTGTPCSQDSDCSGSDTCLPYDFCPGGGSCSPCGTPCDSDAECDDGNSCTDDSCSGVCQNACNASALEDPCCTDPACSGLGMCIACTDTDGDGYGYPASENCDHPEADCDDSNPAVNPGATEECGNGIDDDCDGVADINCPDDYFVYSTFYPPTGYSSPTSVGGYIEDYGVPSTWGDEIQYIYFLTYGPGGGHYAFKVKVWVTNHGGADDPTSYIDIRQHPDNPGHIGPIEPRHFEIVAGPVDVTPYGFYSVCEFHIDSTGVYLGANPSGVHKFDQDLNYIEQVGPFLRNQTLAYNSNERVWYAGPVNPDRTIYELRDTNNDGSWMDETWEYVFTYPSYSGGHHDGLEYVGGFLWISDMTSDVLGKWKYDNNTNTWEEVRRYVYSEPADVEGMGYGPNASFWIGAWTYLYELGGKISCGYPVADAGENVPSYPPTIPAVLDGSGSYYEECAGTEGREIVLYEWDCDGDGVYDYSGTDPATTCTYPAVYNPDGSIDWDATAKTYTAILRVTDNTPPSEGGPQTSVDTCEVEITAPPWRPIADPNGPYNPRVNEEICLDGSGSYHPAATMFDPGHPWYDNIVSWEWDLDNDGGFDDATGETVCTEWSSEGTYFVCLRVTDGAGRTDDECTAVLVDAGVHDVAVASVTPSKSSGICPGEEVTIDVDVSNPGDYTESFDVTLTYDSVLIDTGNVAGLISGGSDSLPFSWDTTGVAEGTYTIEACADIVAGEIIVENNCLETTVEVGCGPICGDLDHDGDVDGDDRNVLRGAFRSCIGGPGYLDEADYDGDGCITFNDYREWYKCYKDFLVL